MKKRILVTGASGFVGLSVMEELSKHNLEVIAMVRKSSNRSELIKRNYKIRCANLMKPATLKRATKNIDFVVNVAASTPGGNPPKGYCGNTRGVQNLVDACKSSRVKKLIHISSFSVTFKKKGIYAKTKEESEKTIIESGIKYILLRPTGIYGARSKDFQKIAKLYTKIPLAIILGNGSHKLQPVYVEDVAKAVYLAIKKEKLTNKIYDIAGPKNITLKNSVKKILNGLSIKRPMIYLPKFLLLSFAKIMEITVPKLKLNPERVEIMFQDRIANVKKTKEDLGYDPISYEDGLKKTIALLKESKK